MTAIAIDLVTTDAALADLRPAWEALWRHAPDTTPFQSPDWLLPWWNLFGTGHPRVATLHRDGSLVGILPLYLFEDGPDRKLLPIGAGITDYQDMLLAPDAPSDTGAALLAAVLAGARQDGVDLCDLIDVPPGAGLREVCAPGTWRAEWRAADPCPVLALPGRLADLRSAIPSRMLRKWRMNQHRAARLGGWTSEVATSETLPALLDSFFELHEARWYGRGVLSHPAIRAFHREAAPLLLRSGSLRLQVLRFGPRVVAAYYTLLAGSRRILFYLSGYDPAWGHASPGTILLGAMIEAAVEEGRAELHFLRGSEGYKYAWGGVDRMNAACRLIPA